MIRVPRMGLRDNMMHSLALSCAHIQDSVRAQLASLKYETKSNQKAGIKRLLVKWHPDRNLDTQQHRSFSTHCEEDFVFFLSPNFTTSFQESAETATSIFQFIQQDCEIERVPLSWTVFLVCYTGQSTHAQSQTKHIDIFLCWLKRSNIHCHEHVCLILFIVVFVFLGGER